MQPKFISSSIRIKPSASPRDRQEASKSSFYWSKLGQSLKRASAQAVRVCVLAEHFAACPVVTDAEREAHLECPLCLVRVVYPE